MKDKTTDLLSAIKEEGITAAFDNSIIQTAVENFAASVLSGPAAPFLGAIFGAVAPRINGMFISYKQKRLERNTKRLIEELANKIDTLEMNYDSLTDQMKEQYKGLYAEMLLDNVIDEQQEEKIKWSVNGFVNMMTNDTNEHVMKIFFDTLSELTVLDIDILRMYNVLSDINWQDIEEKYGIDYDRRQLVKEKLVRFGLLCRVNDQVRDDNLDEIVDYLKKSEAEAKKNKPKTVKFPSGIKKVRNSEAYRITQLGIDFLKSIEMGQTCI